MKGIVPMGCILFHHQTTQIVPLLRPSNLIIVWHGALFIHKGFRALRVQYLQAGPYSGAIFKLTIMFPPHYPSVPPKIRFTSEVYHPLITDHGDFSLRPMGKWIPTQIGMPNILHFIKHSFKKKGLESLREAWCVNADAFKLYLPPRTFPFPIGCHIRGLSV